MNQTRRRQPQYRHVAPALALMITVVIAMAGITFSRLARIPAESSGTVRPASMPMRLVGVRGAEASSTAPSHTEAARDAAAPVKAAAALTVRPTAVAEQAPSAGGTEPAPRVVVEAESRTLPLSPGTLMLGLAAARARSLASASASPAASPAAECNASIPENYDADIAGMTGLPGRKIYYARRAKKNAPVPACRPAAQTANATN